jgi:hypothetical protein
MSQLPQDSPGRLPAALAAMDAAYANLPRLTPGYAVTAQHLRLVIADLPERRFAQGGQGSPA